jgi:hypothetical protein
MGNPLAPVGGGGALDVGSAPKAPDAVVLSSSSGGGD